MGAGKYDAILLGAANQNLVMCVILLILHQFYAKGHASDVWNGQPKKKKKNLCMLFHFGGLVEVLSKQLDKNANAAISVYIWV